MKQSPHTTSATSVPSVPSVPFVSAIVLNYRDPKETVRCVAALLRQSIRDQLEIIVVENHSRDESIGVLRNRLSRYPEVRILESARNRGYGQGNDFGIRRALGRYILVINPDNELEPQGLKRMVEAMEADPRIGILAPRLRHEDGTMRNSARRFPTMTDVFIKRTILRKFFPKKVERYLHQHTDPDAIRTVDWAAGACLLMRRDLYADVGGFDPRFFLFFEDIDLCRRVRAEGYRVVYFPRAEATDRKHRLSEGGFLSLLTKRTVRIHLASALKYFWKWRRA